MRESNPGTILRAVVLTVALMVPAMLPRVASAQTPRTDTFTTATQPMTDRDDDDQDWGWIGLLGLAGLLGLRRREPDRTINVDTTRRP